MTDTALFNGEFAHSPYADGAHVSTGSNGKTSKGCVPTTLTPQARAVLYHLLEHRSISHAEALDRYRVKSLNSVIATIKAVTGCEIRTEVFRGKGPKTSIYRLVSAPCEFHKADSHPPHDPGPESTTDDFPDDDLLPLAPLPPAVQPETVPVLPTRQGNAANLAAPPRVVPVTHLGVCFGPGCEGLQIGDVVYVFDRVQAENLEAAASFLATRLRSGNGA